LKAVLRNYILMARPFFYLDLILGACLRGAICLFFALVIIAAPARSSPSTNSAISGDTLLPEPCVAVTAKRVSPREMVNNKAVFDCKSGQIGVEGPVTWGLFRNLAIVSDPENPWELRHTVSQADDEAVFVHYTDGRLIQASDDRMSARRTFAPNQFGFVLPAGPGTIDTIMVRVAGLQNQRGIAPRPELITARAGLESDIKYLAIYCVLAGVVFSLLVFNFTLFLVLRVRFLLIYCVTAMLTLIVGAAWSGAIFTVFPGMNPTTQISLTLLCASMMILSVTLFMLGFIERRVTSRYLATFTVVAGLVGLASSIIRLIDLRFAWKLMDSITYGSMVAVLIGITLTAAVGWARGSRYARNYLIAWSIPFLLAMLRSVWALGFIGQGTLMVEVSPLVLMALEALLSAIAVAWRVGSVRGERDKAWEMQEQFRQIADVDVLTGLLTRRAFLHRVEGRAERSRPIRLILIDIDQFKLVNDRHGHQAGDDVLMLVAQVLRQTAPENALVGRLGGEEFAVLIEAEPVDAASDRLCKAVAAATTGTGISVTISAGVAEAVVGDEAGWRSLYHAADQALYRSKNGGRNCVSYAPRTIAA
jgi:diguanylate cyclase (GGDEF)-like protein